MYFVLIFKYNCLTGNLVVGPNKERVLVQNHVLSNTFGVGRSSLQVTVLHGTYCRLAVLSPNNLDNSRLNASQLIGSLACETRYLSIIL
jgi:hypothetical protein